MNLMTPAPNFNTEYKPISEEIDEILRGEISAVDAYDQVIENFQNTEKAFNLKVLRDEHKRAVEFWKNEAHHQGKVPEEDAHLWGVMVETFVGASKIIGDTVSLKALKLGEEHGLTNYQKMLTYPSITHDQKLEIKNRFIPRQEKHIDTLTKLIES